MGFNERLAIKVIEMSRLREQGVGGETIKEELNLLQCMSHPYILNAKQLLYDTKRFYIVTEFLEGKDGLGTILDTKNQRFIETDCAKIIKQILLALSYMHKRNITHRDIKLENIVFESKDHKDMGIKVIDFGLSCVFDPDAGGLT